MTFFNKLLLASAVALASASALAMENMDDEALSETAGQAGITIGVTLPTAGMSWSTAIHDSDGFSTVSSAGAIVFGDPTVAGGGSGKTSINTTVAGTEIPILIDATGDIDSGAAVTPSLRVSITVPTGGLTINTGDLSVAKSAGLGATVTNKSATVLSSMQINIGAGATVNMYLGGVSATGADTFGKNMIEINTILTGGLSISNFSLNDVSAGAGGSIFATTVKMCDSSVTNSCTTTNQLQAQVNGSILSGANGGLKLTMAQIGTSGATGGMDIEITGARLGDGSTANIGNIDIVGLQLATTAVRIAGH